MATATSAHPRLNCLRARRSGRSSTKVLAHDELLRDTGAELGSPWQKDHELAMAAALPALAERA